MKQMTQHQAYLAMYAFLEKQYQLSGGAEIGALLGSLSLLPDGSPADPAYAADWASAVEDAFAERVSANMVLRK